MCPICNSINFHIMGIPSIGSKAAKIINKEYKVVKCDRCSLYFVEPKIDFSIEEWKYLYDENYFIENSDWYTKKRILDSKERINNITKLFSDYVCNFLDIGCGEGYSLIEAENRGWNTFGVDITDHRIDAARKDTINFINSDLINSALPSDYFDVVYLDSVLEHVVNPLAYLDEIFRIMKKGGILYLGVPNEDSLFNDVRKIVFKLAGKNITEKIKPFLSPYHINGFNKHSLSFAIRRSGFNIIKLRNFACRVEFMKAKPFTKLYFTLLAILPIYLLAVPFRREVYLEAYVQK